MEDITIAELQSLLADFTRIKRYSALLGDDSGNVYNNPNDPGYVRVRQYQSAGNLSAPFVVPLRAVVNIQPNRPVLLGYDESGQLCVVAPDFNGIKDQGGNPLVDNPADKNLFGFSNQSQILTLASSQTAPPSKGMRVLSLVYGDGDRNYYHFAGKLVNSDYDIDTNIPAAGQHCIAGIFLRYDRDVEVFFSTAKSTSDPVGIDDVTECYAQRSPGSEPIWYWRLHDDQDAVLAEDSHLDARQIVSKNNNHLYSSATTTDATETTLASIVLDEQQMMTVTGCVNGLRSTSAEAIGGTFTAVFRRASGGNITAVGSVVTSIQEDSSGSPAFSVDANTATQSARIRVTGESSKTYTWWTKYEVFRSGITI